MIDENDRSGMKLPEVKAVLRMLFDALSYIHERFIVHRDLKPNNVLFTNSGILKLADFGSARIIDDTIPDKELSHQVATRWYRSPELLFGSNSYGSGLDMWSVGCMIVEMITGKAPFQGNSDIQQLVTIFENLGSPSDENWPTRKSLPCYMDFKPMERKATSEVLFGTQNTEMLELVDGLFALDPSVRITAKKAKQHAIFDSEPKPATLISCHGK